MAIKDRPADERPRENLSQHGAAALSDAELLAIFLRTGVTGISAVELARKLLAQFGSLRALLDAEQKRFCQHLDLGPAKFTQLKATIEMSRRHMASTLTHGNAFTDTQTTPLFLKQRLRDYPYEVFACLWLDKKHRMIAFEELFRGTIDSAQIYPRELLKQALHHNASAVIFAHNRPLGNPEASTADLAVTLQLTKALKLIDIQILDYIIIGDAEKYFFCTNRATPSVITQIKL
jgi:DNA repair protein RadC